MPAPWLGPFVTPRAGTREIAAGLEISLPVAQTPASAPLRLAVYMAASASFKIASGS